MMESILEVSTKCILEVSTKCTAVDMDSKTLMDLIQWSARA